MHIRSLALFPLAALPALLHAQTNPAPPEADGGSLAPVVITGSGSADQRWRGSATVDVVDGSELRNGQL